MLYVETYLIIAGIWGIGIATKKCDLNKLPLGNSPDSWVLRSEGTVAHNNIIQHHLTTIPQEGDIVVSILHGPHNFVNTMKHSLG